MIRKLLLMLVIVIGFGQCKTKTPTKMDDKSTSNTLLKAPVPRGTVRVVAQITQIKPINKNANALPCRDNPCEATIKVEKIIGKGAFFEGEVAEGQTLDAYFVKTLVSTKNIFPNLQQHFPGLKTNERFQADLIYNLKAAKVSKYQVVTYKKL